VPIKSKKNRQINTFQAAKIQHKPRCVTLKNGENLNKICISALPLTPHTHNGSKVILKLQFYFAHLPRLFIISKLFLTGPTLFGHGSKHEIH